MLTRKEALYYDEQLHPAFAGYLFDGTITERDALASIFHLLTKGLLDPVWEDGSMLKGITAVRRTKRTSILPFDQVLINKTFGSKNELLTGEIGSLIKRGFLQDLIRDNLQAISAFPIVNEELKFALGKHGKITFLFNGNKVDTLEEAATFRKLLYGLFLPLFLGVGVLMMGSAETLLALLAGAFFVAAPLHMLFSFVFSKKTITYDLKDKVVPVAKKKYEELYQFIKANPLPKHRFINEFLAFAIAFGFDDSCHNDFGVEKEFRIDSSPLA